jgi:amidase
MAWLADGSDFGGSLRIPAAFCGVVGLRPSPGRVPQGARAMPFQTLDVIGPMARDVRDVALMLDALSGEEAGDPLSLPTPRVSFAAAAERSSGVRRVATCFAPGASVPVDPEIAAGLESVAGRLQDAGLVLQPASLEIEPAIEAFATLRALQFAAELGPVLQAHRRHLKPELVANIEAGYAVGGRELIAAEQARGRFVAGLLALFRTVDILALPATILPPFEIDRRFPEELQGVRFATYFHWAAPTLVISLTGCPALSLPCGSTGTDLPIGLQLVAPPRQEARLLAFARELEERFGVSGRLPIEPTPLDERS